MIRNIEMKGLSYEYILRRKRLIASSALDGIDRPQAVSQGTINVELWMPVVSLGNLLISIVFADDLRGQAAHFLW